jgi:hypothetical protein
MPPPKSNLVYTSQQKLQVFSRSACVGFAAGMRNIKRRRDAVAPQGCLKKDYYYRVAFNVLAAWLDRCRFGSEGSIGRSEISAQREQ